MSLGERFRAAREERGLSLSDVAEQIRIRSVYLAAIEDENWSAIGAPVYIRGFIRTYARFLGLDSAEAVSQFNEAMGAPAAGGDASSQTQRSSVGLGVGTSENRGLSPLIWIASLVALALVAFVVYLYFTPPKGGSTPVAGGPAATGAPGVPAAGETSAASSEASGSPLPSATPTIIPSKETLAIHLTESSWVRVTVDGTVSAEGTFPAGTNKTFHGKVALLRVGNAGGVEVTVNGKPLGRLGATGDVVEKSYTL
ncbi:MAG: helix-turn-helix domain-containing protein [Candidatus Eremiobacteraeota bacterium]|nr:helix-turn-helix domain-containing protein [Candidatus Eremiobacteraeota bacterium]